ncbi:hypothetical protein DLR60_00020 [Vibrio tarriae]|nr:hypothetical protein DLR59_16545 [Vibrio tarriae]RBM27827.1 hypothetical protein DLR61_14055 [Vibrio tarriae]RBM32037.1 hypothetical protein DLR58_15350 [Vibrio tarriae]RBM41698.1 hypothetical protein DLR63_04005 [Vibrio tarriae]RBM42763.1 hypothetical protein DLR62_03400 [Vibrio tarriae]
MLATFVYPNHIVCLCSWGFTHLPPTCNSKSFGYRYDIQRIWRMSEEMSSINCRADVSRS